MSRMTRRGMLAAAGSAAAAALGWWFGPRATRASSPSDTSAASTRGYVDHDGWMLSVEDKAAIDAAPHAEISD